MKKYLGLIIVVGIVWFLVFYEGPYSQFTNKGITVEDTQYIEEITENKKLISLLKNEYKDLINNVNIRNEQCQKNAQEFFKNSPPEIYVETNILRSLDLVFKNTLERKVSEILYNKVDDMFEAKITFTTQRAFRFRQNIEICRPKKSLKYISNVLNKILKFQKENIKKITTSLIKNIDMVLIGEQDSFINLRLAFYYLSKMEELGLIHGEFPQKKYQLELFENQCIYNAKKAKNNDELLKVYNDCRGKLRKLATMLKTSLKAFTLN